MRPNLTPLSGGSTLTPTQTTLADCLLSWNAGWGLSVYAHPDLFPERFSRREGHLEPKGLPLTPDLLRWQADLALLVVEPTVSGVHEWLAC
jgi:hypothetical protein